MPPQRSSTSYDGFPMCVTCLAFRRGKPPRLSRQTTARVSTVRHLQVSHAPKVERKPPRESTYPPASISKYCTVPPQRRTPHSYVDWMQTTNSTTTFLVETTASPYSIVDAKTTEIYTGATLKPTSLARTIGYNSTFSCLMVPITWFFVGSFLPWAAR